MQDRDRRRYDRLTRVQTFVREHAAEFPAGSAAPARFESLERQRIELEAAMAAQQPDRVNTRAFVSALRRTCRQIAGTAASIARNDPTFSGNYKLPSPINDLALMAHAASLLVRLEDQPDDSSEVKASKKLLRARFMAYEHPENFVETLRGEQEAVRDAIHFNQIETQEGVANTSRIGTLLDSITRDIKDLDAIMTNKYRDQPEKFRAWRSASRLEASPRKRVAKPATA